MEKINVRRVLVLAVAFATLFLTVIDAVKGKCDLVWYLSLVRFTTEKNENF